VAYATFYERGFGVPAHRFLRFLLQFYGLELHHLTPSGILHIAAFVTLCETYMGIESHFNLWNYFICAQLQQGSSAEVMALAVWTSSLYTDVELIPTSTSRCSVLWTGGGKYGSDTILNYHAPIN
jgi:hypothetical protein